MASSTSFGLGEPAAPLAHAPRSQALRAFLMLAFCSLSLLVFGLLDRFIASTAQAA